MYKFEYWKHPVTEKWNWHFIAPNGQIMFGSTQGHNSKGDCIRAIEAVKRNAAHGILVNIDKGVTEDD